MKYGNVRFMEVKREIFNAEYIHMSDPARVLFFFLNECEQRYTTGQGIGLGKSFFYRSDESIAADLNWSVSKVQRAKKELKQTKDLVEIWQGNFPNGEALSEKHITFYRIS